MAAYGKDDFYYGSDFSDVSDDSDHGDFSGESLWSDDDEDVLRYCVCGLPASTEMIACDSGRCNIEWFHYQCVGLSPDTVPEDSWLCEFCRPPADGCVPASSSVTTGGCVSMTQPASSSEETGGKKRAHIKKTKDGNPKTKASTKTPTETPSTVDATSVQPKSSSSTGKAKVSSKSTPSSSTGKAKNSSKSTKTKEGKKTATKTVEQPPSKFTQRDAKERAPGYFKAALQLAGQHDVFTAAFPLALCVMSLITTLSTLTESAEFLNFCQASANALWVVITAGDCRFLKPEAMELVWKAFHRYKLQSNVKWREFLKSVNIDCSGQHVLILYQYLLQNVLHLIMKDRFSTDMPEKQKIKDPTPISKQEEQVLRYVAGYVPFALYKKFKRQVNQTAETFCDILSSWRTCNTDTEKTFLEYSNEWINSQNRGALFHVNDEVYLFFKTMEQQTRPFLSKDNLVNFPGVNIKVVLKEEIMSQGRVHNYWCNLTRGKITGSPSKRLLDSVVNLWIKIRITSFVKVCLDLKKASGKASKKAEKALRKSLPS